MLATARKAGVRTTGWATGIIPPHGDPLQALREMKPRVAALASLNREIGIRGGYQNHVGTRVGGSVWDLGVLLEGVAPDGLGVQYDIRHAVAEGGESWPVALRMIAPHIDTIAVKDFRLVAADRTVGGSRAACRSARGWWSFPAYLPQLLAARAAAAGDDALRVCTARDGGRRRRRASQADGGGHAPRPDAVPAAACRGAVDRRRIDEAKS